MFLRQKVTRNTELWQKLARFGSVYFTKKILKSELFLRIPDA